ncbi:MAG: phytoene desaturase family protein [Candidatus Binatia bacterium]
MDQERERWDAVVIGSGLGGLACSAYLCAAGKRALVLEAHYVAGGNTQTFRRGIHGRKYEFDVGVHYIGECGPEGMITRILRGVGLAGRVNFRPLDPDGYSTLIFPDFRFRVPAGWERYRARLLETFPDEVEPLGRVVDILREVADTGQRLQSGEVQLHEILPDAQTFVNWGLRPVTDLFGTHGLSQQASAVLLGEQGDYAVRPSRTPTALVAGLTDHYMRGAFYPEGGGQVIAARLIEAIRAYGGEVRTRAPVERVRIENGRVAGVTLAKGEMIDADIVVSNADLKRTVHDLVGEQHFAADTVERVRGFRMALPLFVVYLGLDVDLAAQGVPNTNLIKWGSYDIEGIYEQLEGGKIPDEDLVYITVATLKDPTSRRLAPIGHSNLQIMTLAPREYALWNAAPDAAANGLYKRDPEYRRRKEELAERLIAAAECELPGIRDHVDWKEAATPITQERFTQSTGGTSYGVEFACDQMGPMRMGPSTEIPGLYLAGASTPSGHGIGGVLRSGVVAASAALERDLFKQAVSGEVLGDPDRLPELRDDWDPWRESH